MLPKAAPVLRRLSLTEMAGVVGALGADGEVRSYPSDAGLEAAQECERRRWRASAGETEEPGKPTEAQEPAG